MLNEASKLVRQAELICSTNETARTAGALPILNLPYKRYRIVKTMSLSTNLG